MIVGLDSPYRISCWCIIVTYGLTLLLYKTQNLEIWMTLNLTFQGHSRLNVVVSLDSPYMVAYWYIYSNRMPISRRLAVIIAARNVFSYLFLMIWPKLRNIESAPNDLKMTLNATRPKIPHIYWTTTRESQISLRFALRSLVFQIIEVLDFSIGYNGEFEIFEKQIKSLKIGNSKFQKFPRSLDLLLKFWVSDF